MRLITKYILISALFFLNTSCAAQQQYGDDIRLEQPFLLSDQHWKITQQITGDNGDHICTVSSGEMDVTQRSHDHVVEQQVATFNKLNPGDSYKILVGGHYYETIQGWFDPSQSQAIIKDLMSNTVAYTEMRGVTLGTGSGLRSIDNKISTYDFGHQYKICKKFVKSLRK